jgi:UPF0271 protein
MVNAPPVHGVGCGSHAAHARTLAVGGRSRHDGAVPAIDLNADLGEVPGDLVLMGTVSSANIACGGHAGDERSMGEAVEAAAARGVVVGAHPSYDDRANFGRSDLDEPDELVAAGVAVQVGRLCRLTTVEYVKLHGALYHRANRDPATAEAILDALEPLPVRHVLAQPGALLDRARARGWGATVEGYCDRAYRDDGTLVARSEGGAVLERAEEVVHQALELAASEGIGSLCLHGDTPGAARLAAAVRTALEQSGVEIRPFV